MPRHFRRGMTRHHRGGMRRTRHVHHPSTNYVRYVHNCMYRATMSNFAATAAVDDAQVAFWSYETLFNLATSDSIVNSYCNIYKWYRIRKTVISIQCKVGELNATTSFTAQQGRIGIVPIHDESDIRLFTPLSVITPTNVGTYNPPYDIRYIRTLKHYKELYRGLNTADNKKLTLVMTPSTFEEEVVNPAIGSASVATFRLKPVYKRWLEVFDSSNIGNPFLDSTQHFGYAWFLYAWIWPATLGAGIPLDVNCKVYIEFKEHRGVGSGFAPPVPPVETEYKPLKYKSGNMEMVIERNRPIVAPALGPRPIGRPDQVRAKILNTRRPAAEARSERSEEKLLDYDTCSDDEMKK